MKPRLSDILIDAVAQYLGGCELFYVDGLHGDVPTAQTAETCRDWAMDITEIALVAVMAGLADELAVKR